MSAITRSSRTVEHKAGTLLAKTVTSAAVGAAGAFSVYFVSGAQPDPISVAVVAGTFGISACMSPVMSRMAGLAHGVARWGFAAAAIGFTLLDAFGMASGFFEKERAPIEAAYVQDMASYQDAISADRNIIEAETKKVAQIDTALLERTAPVWDAAIYTYGSRYQAALSAFEAETEKLEKLKAAALEAVTEARQRIAGAPEPVMAELPPNLFLWAFCVSLVIQGLIAISFVSIGVVEGAEPAPVAEPETKKAAPVIETAEKPRPVYDQKNVILLAEIGERVRAG